MFVFRGVEANESVFAVYFTASLHMLMVVQAARTLPRLFFAVVFLNLVYTMAAKFVFKLTFSPDDIAAADQLLESLLRSLKVHDSAIMATRVNEVLDRALFTDLA